MASNTESEGSVRIQLDLTEEQQAYVRNETGITGQTMEFSIEPLEERVVPIIAILISLNTSSSPPPRLP